MVKLDIRSDEVQVLRCKKLINFTYDKCNSRIGFKHDLSVVPINASQNDLMETAINVKFSELVINNNIEIK